MPCSVRGSRRWGAPGLLIVAIAAVAAGAADRRYVVQPGDTPRSVAAAQGVGLPALLAANSLAEETPLEAGRVLSIPEARPAVHRVQAGENLYRISQKYQLSVDELAAANGIEPDTILQIGQELKLPGGAEPEPALAPPADRPEARPAEVPQPTTPAAALAAPVGPPRPDGGQIPETVYVCESRVHLRAGASTQAQSLKLVSWGTALTVVGKDGMWWQVRLPGSERNAYVAGWVVRTQPLGGAPGGGTRLCYAYVAQPKVNIRSEPSTESPRIAVADQGTRMEVMAAEGGWLRVRFENGTEGWLARPLARLPRGASSEQASADGRRLADTAMTYIGTPYSRGGESHGGADCSGLVYASTRELGISLPRSSRAMFGHGTPIDRGALQPGDLVFFSNTYRSGISHVGVYIGNNEFVHAVKPGVRATITSLSDEYYARHYAGARRVTD